MGVRWAKQARHTSQMDRLRMRGELELAVAAPARPLGAAFRTRRRDGLATTTAAAVWLLEGAVELPFSTC